MKCDPHLLEVGVEMEWVKGWPKEGVKDEILAPYTQGWVS